MITSITGILETNLIYLSELDYSDESIYSE